MLYLYQSNRLEDLAALLQAVKTRQPLRLPLAPEEIVVQSQGMRRFLSRYLAEQTGIAANLKFSLPAGLAWRLMRDMLPDVPQLNPFSSEVLRWRLLGLFSDRHFDTAPEFARSSAALRHYLQRGGNAAYQTAGLLADIFDQYLIYRADWLDAWREGKLIGLGGNEAWQAELWRFLDQGSQAAPHRAALWRQLLDALDAAKLPERFFVFGTATLAPLYLQLLQALSAHCDIHLFALNPSSEYWGNITDPAQTLHNGSGTQADGGHPLLASLGKQGRDFFDALTEAGAQNEFAVYADEAPSAKLLHRLQHDIQTLSPPQPAPHDPLDRSIRIVSAHSPLRELQILKDHILRMLHENPDWQPHDIAVLTPHIEPYSPYIEAVFGQSAGGAQALPYAVSDIKLSLRQPLLHALEQTLDLLESRFETDKVLPLLENEIVLRRFGLGRQDLPLLHETVSRLNIHWGWDAGMRQSQDALFTWQQGLDRLILGWMLPAGTRLWQNTGPLPSDLNLLEPLGRFAALLRTLGGLQKTWRQDTDVASWVQRIRSLLSALFAPESGDEQAVQQIEQAISLWQEEADLAGFRQALPQHTAIRHIKRFLESRSEAGFLRRGITFCSMVPMRSLPFKAICLLGLNDGEFPRNTRAPLFDLIALFPRKGDRARRDDDRYLFLEAIMSAREVLYLSYRGRSIRNNDVLAPSAVLPDLTDTLAAMTGETPARLTERLVEQHPLQAFSTQYFVSDRPLSGSRRDYAEALNRPRTEPQPFFTAPPENAPPENAAVAQAQLIRFWRNPVREWLRRSLDWHAPYIDQAWDSAEPFQPEQRERINTEYTEARRRNARFSDTAAELAARSMLPAGELGLLWHTHFEAAAKSLPADLVQSPKLPPFPYRLRLGGHILEGSITRLYQHGLIDFQSKTPNAAERIQFLIEHLILNSVRPAGADKFQSHRLLPDGPVTLPEVPQPEAAALLEKWLDFYALGQTRPLPFFPKTSLAAADAWLKNQDKEDAAGKARKAAEGSYYGSKENKGQQDYTEVALVFGGAENPLDGALFWNLVEHLLLPALAACQSSEEAKA